MGVPASISDHPFSGLGTVIRQSLAIESIVILVQFTDALSVNLALSLGAATQPAERAYTKPRFLSCLTFVGQGFHPVWMRMHYIVIIVWLADWNVLEQLLPDWLIVTPELALCCAFLPFALFAALWIAYVAIDTLWSETLWQVVYSISTRIAARAIIAQFALVAVVVMRVLAIHMPSFDISLLVAIFHGWPIPYLAIENCQRVEPVQAMFREALETCYSLYSLFENGRTLSDIVFL
ncbi:hypothetical protein NPX13_g2866 [Xylaria arbuscula]|uniref:Uncharacterized protein n=1 Tax=Xylaria arbuscula TaxID=114810 RepID=A0A9W8NJA4_9PEZI|nr:hypothetical protein NPX13_g2866 [Xylaria arbuscula]